MTKFYVHNNPFYSDMFKTRANRSFIQFKKLMKYFEIYRNAKSFGCWAEKAIINTFKMHENVLSHNIM